MSWQRSARRMFPVAAWTFGEFRSAGYSMFTYGMAMNYLRTHSQVMRQAINVLATVSPTHVSCGGVDIWGIRENAYRSNVWMSNEMLGAPRSPLLQRNIDKLMGNQIGRA